MNENLEKIVPPNPKNRDVNYVVRYESEIDRGIIQHAMGDYIQEVLGTQEFLFVKVPMAAVNKMFHISPQYPGEEIEFNIDHKHNNIIRCKTLVGDELPPIWAVYLSEDESVRLITTIEPCKFIMRADDLPAFEAIMAKTEIAPPEYNYEALKSVHWNDTTAILRRDIEFFVAGKKFFDSRGMAYSRSYLLHGPPGNGKTTTIKAIAKFLNTRPESFDFSSNSQSPDATFQSWVLGESERIAREEEEDDDDEESQAKTPIRLLVLEDIDRFFPKDGLKHTSVSLQAVLQALDGAIERRNMIIIATANHPEDLDQQVLARPGRFDKQVFYEQPTEEQAFMFLRKLFDGEQVSDDILRDACEKLHGHSYAFHKELFATSASYAIERTSHIIENDDVRKGIDDLLQHVDRVALKSQKESLGFD